LYEDEAVSVFKLAKWSSISRETARGQVTIRNQQMSVEANVYMVGRGLAQEPLLLFHAHRFRPALHHWRDCFCSTNGTVLMEFAKSKPSYSSNQPNTYAFKGAELRIYTGY